MSLCFSILQALPAFMYTLLCAQYMSNCKNPRVPGSEHRCHGWEDPGTEPLNRSFLSYHGLGSFCSHLCLDAGCLCLKPSGRGYMVPDEGDFSCTCSPVFPQLQSSSERRSGDGSHASDILAPGELWVLHLFL